jgi:shikimate kinase
MVITLIGYRGSGKTTLAAPLAKLLQCDWADADVEIERRAGKTIREIFQDEGEPVFRRWEREVIAELLTRPDLVLAAGGGAILEAEIRNRMRDAGPVVWLRASLETLLKRIESDPTTGERRPKLTAAGGRAEVESLLGLREPLYRECAHFILDVEQAAPEALAQTVADWVAAWRAKGPPA